MIRSIFAMLTMLTAVGLASGAMAQKPAALDNGLPTVTICTASVDGNYQMAGQQIALQAKGVLNVVLVPTAGSLENLAKIENGTCLAGVIQSDAYGVFRAKNSSSQLSLEISTSLYDEQVHLICSKAANLSKITGLTRDMTILVGPPGSGSSVTWDAFKASDPKRYGVVSQQPIGGLRAVNKVKLGGPDATCMLAVTGMKSPAMIEANKIALADPDTLVLVPADDSDLLKLKSPGKGAKEVYSSSQIPSGTYPGGLQKASLFGSSVNTVSVHALFVVNSDYIDAHPGEYDKLLRAVTNALPSIKNKVEPR